MPAEVIVGIVGVETFYGRITGGFKVLDALATLAFDFPAEHPRAADRQSFFRSELAEFLKLCRENGLDTADVRGSYAGALGWPQFMPGSWRKHAVDFDGDGRIDLIGSPVDAIGSVAHYLSEYGWKPGEATHYSVRLPADPITRRRLLAPDIKPTFTAAELQEAGAEPSEAARDHVGAMAVIELQNGPNKPTTVLLGTQNFWVVTRYNWSAYYALGSYRAGAGGQGPASPGHGPAGSGLRGGATRSLPSRRRLSRSQRDSAEPLCQRPRAAGRASYQRDVTRPVARQPRRRRVTEAAAIAGLSESQRWLHGRQQHRAGRGLADVVGAPAAHRRAGQQHEERAAFHAPPTPPGRWSAARADQRQP